jgi:dihydroxyacid dehydratase/phosphogluconate dehydratase
MVPSSAGSPAVTSGTERSAERRSEGHMSRNLILATGALLWTITAVDALAHVVTGDWIVPASMAVVAVAWVVLRRPSWRLAEAS